MSPPVLGKKARRKAKRLRKAQRQVFTPGDLTGFSVPRGGITYRPAVSRSWPMVRDCRCSAHGAGLHEIQPGCNPHLALSPGRSLTSRPPSAATDAILATANLEAGERYLFTLSGQ